LFTGQDWVDGRQSARLLGLRDHYSQEADQRGEVPSEMEVVMPWQSLHDLIEPHYPMTNKKGGRPPYPLATMLRIHLLQHWFSDSEPAMKEALIEVPTIRRFAGIELNSNRIPNETTSLSFRHLLKKHKLGEQFLRRSKLTSALEA